MKNMRKRSESIIVRLTEEEMEELNEKVKLTGLPRERYIREVLLKETPKAAPSDVSIKVLHQLSAIGNNINQLAKHANETGEIRHSTLKKELQELHTIYMSLKNII